MDPLGSSLSPSLRNLQRVAGILGGLVVFTTQEAHALAAENVDGWDQDHGRLIHLSTEFHKVVEDVQAELLALFRVELHRGEIPALNRGAEDLLVFSLTGDNNAIPGNREVRVDEVEEGVLGKTP